MAERRTKTKGLPRKPESLAEIGNLLVEKLNDIAVGVNGVLDLLRAEVSLP